MEAARSAFLIVHAPSPAFPLHPDWPHLRIPISILLSVFFLALLLWRFWKLKRHLLGDRGPRPHPRAGLNKVVLASFPVLEFKAMRKVLPEGKCATECPVCLSEFGDLEYVRLLTVCCHVFHPKCIDVWLKARKTCPVCRADLNAPPDKAVVAAAKAAMAAVDGGGGGGGGAQDILGVVEVKVTR